MYFESRAEAGHLLAEQLLPKYRYEDMAVVSIDSGGVLVGEQIATSLHCVLTMLVTESIDVPGESLSFGAVSQAGNFTHNRQLSNGEIFEYTSEFHGYLEDQKRQAFSRINRLVGDGGVINRNLLKDRMVILVSEGFSDSAVLSVALDYLKPIRIRKLIVASPVATIPAVDQLHVMVDEIHILDVKENYMGANHYYADNKVPGREELVRKINQAILNWQ